MLARFPWEIHAWLIPLIAATGWVLGYVHFRDRFRRKHPDLYDEWLKRTSPGEAADGSDSEEQQK